MAHVRRLSSGAWRIEIKRTYPPEEPGGEPRQFRWSHYMDPDPELTPLQNERKAEKIGHLGEDDLDQGVHPQARYEVMPVLPSRAQTVGEWAPVWLGAQNVEPRSRDGLRSILNAHVLPRWRDVPLIAGPGGISRIAAQAWLTHLTRDKQRNGRPRSSGTVANIWGAFERLVEDAVAEGILDRSPLTTIDAPRASRLGRSRHILTPTQIFELADACLVIPKRCKKPGNVQWRWHRLIKTKAWTGNRWSELAGLRRAPDEVRLMERPPVIVVREPSKRAKGLGRYHGEPKSEAGGRSIELIKPVGMLLAEQMTDGYAYVFGTRRNTMHEYAEFEKAFKAAAKKVGHPEWTPHDLRATHATWLRRCQRRAVQERLGHMPADVTDIYTAVELDDRAEILRVLQDRWDEAERGAAAAPVAEQA